MANDKYKASNRMNELITYFVKNLPTKSRLINGTWMRDSFLGREANAFLFTYLKNGENSLTPSRKTGLEASNVTMLLSIFYSKGIFEAVSPSDDSITLVGLGPAGTIQSFSDPTILSPEDKNIYRLNSRDPDKYTLTPLALQKESELLPPLPTSAKHAISPPLLLTLQHEDNAFRRPEKPQSVPRSQLPKSSSPSRLCQSELRSNKVKPDSDESIFITPPRCRRTDSAMMHRQTNKLTAATAKPGELCAALGKEIYSQCYSNALLESLAFRLNIEQSSVIWLQLFGRYLQRYAASIGFYVAYNIEKYDANQLNSDTVNALLNPMIFLTEYPFAHCDGATIEGALNLIVERVTENSPLLPPLLVADLVNVFLYIEERDSEAHRLQFQVEQMSVIDARIDSIHFQTDFSKQNPVSKMIYHSDHGNEESVGTVEVSRAISSRSLHRSAQLYKQDTSPRSEKIDEYCVEIPKYNPIYAHIPGDSTSDQHMLTLDDNSMIEDRENEEATLEKEFTIHPENLRRIKCLPGLKLSPDVLRTLSSNELNRRDTNADLLAHNRIDGAPRSTNKYNMISMVTDDSTSIANQSRCKEMTPPQKRIPLTPKMASTPNKEVGGARFKNCPQIMSDVRQQMINRFKLADSCATKHTSHQLYSVSLQDLYSEENRQRVIDILHICLLSMKVEQRVLLHRVVQFMRRCANNSDLHLSTSEQNKYVLLRKFSSIIINFDKLDMAAKMPQRKQNNSDSTDQISFQPTSANSNNGFHTDPKELFEYYRAAMSIIRIIVEHEKEIFQTSKTVVQRAKQLVDIELHNHTTSIGDGASNGSNCMASTSTFGDQSSSRSSTHFSNTTVSRFASNTPIRITSLDRNENFEDKLMPTIAKQATPQQYKDEGDIETEKSLRLLLDTYVADSDEKQRKRRLKQFRSTYPKLWASSPYTHLLPNENSGGFLKSLMKLKM